MCAACACGRASATLALFLHSSQNIAGMPVDSVLCGVQAVCSLNGPCTDCACPTGSQCVGGTCTPLCSDKCDSSCACPASAPTCDTDGTCKKLCDASTSCTSGGCSCPAGAPLCEGGTCKVVQITTGSTAYCSTCGWKPCVTYALLVCPCRCMRVLFPYSQMCAACAAVGLRTEWPVLRELLLLGSVYQRHLQASVH